MYMQLYNLDALISLMIPYMYSALLPISALSRLNLAIPLPALKVFLLTSTPIPISTPIQKRVPLF